MDWDRTGGRLQTGFRDRLMALDIPVDEALRRVLLKVMKPEGRTVESLTPHSSTLTPMIDEILRETD
jgi:5S rRNA maturation endonuclease (ribonuclease M5)